MSDCNSCPVETICGYQYKPCDCVHQRKFRLREHVTDTSHGMTLDKAFWFNTREDRDKVYAKLVEVLS